MAIIDHDAGNLRSIVCALAKLGCESVVASDTGSVLGAGPSTLSDLIGILTRSGKQI